MKNSKEAEKKEESKIKNKFHLESESDSKRSTQKKIKKYNTISKTCNNFSQSLCRT